MRRSTVAALLLAGVLQLGCGTVKIGRILSDPSHYQNRNVRVRGTVTQSVGALVAGAYQVEDETGKIYVLSNRGAPSTRSEVAVSGTVTSGIQVMGRTVGTVIREQGRDLKRPAPPRKP